MPAERIIVGMSGGVDSAVAALLLTRAGYEVIAVTLRLQDCAKPDGTRASCCGVDSVAQARAVAGQLGLRHYVLDAQADFADRVLHPCWEEYRRCRTPNPCVWCNEYIKFGRLLEFARSLDAPLVATGHYARQLQTATGPELRRGTDRHKDQSYFLFSLSAEQLAAARFPLGELTKPAVRQLAREVGLGNANRQDSQDICFATADGSFADYLLARFGGQPLAGNFVDAQGRTLQPHGGAHRYTVGQRRGTGVALGSRAWVQAIDAGSGNVTLTTEESHLLAAGLTARGVVWHTAVATGQELACTIQTRYRQAPVTATVVAGPDATATVRFGSPVKAVCPGQAVVFYDDDKVLGGGWIERPCG